MVHIRRTTLEPLSPLIYGIPIVGDDVLDEEHGLVENGNVQECPANVLLLLSNSR